MNSTRKREYRNPKVLITSLFVTIITKSNYPHDGKTQLHACELDEPASTFRRSTANNEQQRKIEGLKLGQVVAKDLVGLHRLKGNRYGTMSFISLTTVL